MKTAARGVGGRDAVRSEAVQTDHGTSVRCAVEPSFRIFQLQRVNFGSKRATFELHLLDSQVCINADLFMPDGAQPFIAPASVRSKYSGQWERRAWIGEGLGSDILEAVLERLLADEHESD